MARWVPVPVPPGPPLPARALPPLPPTPQSPPCSGAGSAVRCGTSARLVPPPATGQVPAGPERSPGRAAPRGGAGPGRRARCGGTGAGPARLGTERNGTAERGRRALEPVSGAGEGSSPAGLGGIALGTGRDREPGPGVRPGSRTRTPPQVAWPESWRQLWQSLGLGSAGKPGRDWPGGAWEPGQGCGDRAGAAGEGQGDRPGRVWGSR